MQLKAVEKEESSEAVKVAWWWKDPVVEISKRKSSLESPPQTILVLSGETAQWFIGAGSFIVPSLFHLSIFHSFTEWSLFLRLRDKLEIKKEVRYQSTSRSIESGV